MQARRGKRMNGVWHMGLRNLRVLQIAYLVIYWVEIVVNKLFYLTAVLQRVFWFQEGHKCEFKDKLLCFLGVGKDQGVDSNGARLV